ncbi:MAG: amidohydrolase family protein [Clostridiales bacterium]|nr:amidohydrolase family protein [Clostridiales bacterium]
MTAFINARVIDAAGSPPIDCATVIVSGSRIEAVGARLDTPENANIIDLKGKTLLPAFSDAHTHFGGSDRLSRPALGGRDITYDFAYNSMADIRWGVTTIRSAGDFMPDIVSFRDEVISRQLNAPRILTAGRMFVAPGGHPIDTVYSGSEAIRDNACVVCYENTDIESEVKALTEAGVDWIKVFISTLNKMNYPHPVPRIPRAVIARIINASHKYGKPVMVHVEDLRDMEEAAELGADSIEHCIGVGSAQPYIPSESLLNKLVGSGVYVVPTMSAIKAHDGMLNGAEPVFPHLLKAVKAMHDAGVKLAVGCDSGIPFLSYGECVHIEMELLSRAGLTPMEVICAATKGNAALFGMQDHLGTIESGMLADIVILEADPLEDIKNTGRIMLVMKEGRIMFDRLLNASA